MKKAVSVLMMVASLCNSVFAMENNIDSDEIMDMFNEYIMKTHLLMILNLLSCTRISIF